MSMPLTVEYRILEPPNNHSIVISTDGYQPRHTKKRYEIRVSIKNLTTGKGFTTDVDVLYKFNDRPISELFRWEIAIVKKWFIFCEELRDNTKRTGLHPVPIIDCVKSFCTQFDYEYKLFETPPPRR